MIEEKRHDICPEIVRLIAAVVIAVVAKLAVFAMPWVLPQFAG